VHGAQARVLSLQRGNAVSQRGKGVFYLGHRSFLSLAWSIIGLCHRWSR
jgi:hypothetical protein